MCIISQKKKDEKIRKWENNKIREKGADLVINNRSEIKTSEVLETVKCAKNQS